MTLQEEITTDPLNRGYQQFVPHAPGIIADMMNNLIYSMPKEKFVNARGILAKYGVDGAQILDKLESAVSSNSAVKWAMRFITSEGIDLGHPTARNLIDQLVVGTVLTQDEADKLKNMAVQPASRADILGLPYVSEHDVRIALGV